MTIKPAPHRLSRADFIAAFGGIYEHSPWVAERLFDAGLSAHDADPTNLARRMAEIVDAAGYDKQIGSFMRPSRTCRKAGHCRIING
jgi:2-oxo-4-hydroxy-4-carboxy--5-ureidoimidazoline (OHCU) decarboxylase